MSIGDQSEYELRRNSRQPIGEMNSSSNKRWTSSTSGFPRSTHLLPNIPPLPRCRWTNHGLSLCCSRIFSLFDVLVDTDQRQEVCVVLVLSIQLHPPHTPLTKGYSPANLASRVTEPLLVTTPTGRLSRSSAKVVQSLSARNVEN